MEDTKAQHSFVTKRRHIQSLQSPSSWREERKEEERKKRVPGFQIFILRFWENLGVQFIASAAVDIGTKSLATPFKQNEV